MASVDVPPAVQLSLESTPDQVALWIEHQYFTDQAPLFRDLHVCGRSLSHLTVPDLMSQLGFVLHGDALRLLAQVRQVYEGSSSSIAHSMCPVEVSRWLKAHRLAAFAKQILDENICGHGLLIMTPSELFSMGLLMDTANVDVFFEERVKFFATEDVEDAVDVSSFVDLQAHSESAGGESSLGITEIAACVSKAGSVAKMENGASHEPGLPSPSTPCHRRNDVPLEEMSPLKSRKVTVSCKATCGAAPIPGMSKKNLFCARIIATNV